MTDTTNEPFDVEEMLQHPDVVVTEDQGIAKGWIVPMDAWGVASFRGEPVASVSRALFDALKKAFRLAATAGMNITEQQWRDAGAVLLAEGTIPPDLADLDDRTGLVPPWALLGDLLQVFIATARDTAGPGEPRDQLYATDAVKALDGDLIWLQRPRPGQWTAFLPDDI